MKAVVCFGGASKHPLAGLLKPGFAHCFTAVLSAGCWILVDGQEGVPTVKYLTTEDFDLAAFYRGKGYTVVETEQQDRPIRSPLALTNCVGLCKAVLCIRAPWAFTPWRLYRHMTRNIT